MQSRVLLALASVLALSGCALLGFGPPTTVIEGDVYLADDQSLIPYAEVCAFGMDTTCVRADEHGHYHLRRRQQTIVLRFRAGTLTPAVSDTIHLIPPGHLTVDCSIPGALVLSDRPVPCQPAPAR